jgi:hypothetical protein
LSDYLLIDTLAKHMHKGKSSTWKCVFYECLPSALARGRSWFQTYADNWEIGLHLADIRFFIANIVCHFPRVIEGILHKPRTRKYTHKVVWVSSPTFSAICCHRNALWWEVKTIACDLVTPARRTGRRLQCSVNSDIWCARPELLVAFKARHCLLEVRWLPLPPIWPPRHHRGPRRHF